MPHIRHELIIEATAETVYRAITSHEGLSAWWTPETTVQEGATHVLRFSFGSNYFKAMQVAALKPLEFVQWNCINGADEWVGTTISFKLYPGDKASLLTAHPEAAGQAEQLQSDNGGTLLVFEHDNWRDYTPMYAECNYTWGQFLRSLKLYCETGKGKPWPNQHRVGL